MVWALDSRLLKVGSGGIEVRSRWKRWDHGGMMVALEGGSQVEVRWDQGGTKVAFQGGSEVEVRWDQGLRG